jgi:hypothetical protein
MTIVLLTALTVLVGILLLVVGAAGGWFAFTIYQQWLEFNTHPYADLIMQAPHPECFDEEGNPILEDYWYVDFSEFTGDEFGDDEEWEYIDDDEY